MTSYFRCCWLPHRLNKDAFRCLLIGFASTGVAGCILLFLAITNGLKGVDDGLLMVMAAAKIVIAALFISLTLKHNVGKKWTPVKIGSRTQATWL